MKQIIYFADPMCSWCYGFTGVIDEIETKYGDKLDIKIIPGGYSPGTTEPMKDDYKEMLQRVWSQIEQRTGMPFDTSMKFATADFCYDTEPPSRAFAVIQKLQPNVEWPFFKALQKAFYADNLDLTKEEVLADLAEEFGVERDRFIEQFRSEELKQLTEQGFITSQSMGIRGFPTLVGISGQQGQLITHGYQPFSALQEELENWLKS